VILGLLVLSLLGAVAGASAFTFADQVLQARGEGIPPMPAWGRPLSAVATAALFLGAVGVVGWSGVLPAYLWFVDVTVTLVATDVHSQLIPDRITLPGTVVAAVLLLIGALFDGDADRLPAAAVGAAVYAVLLLALFMAAPGGGFGGGDVKLAPLLGLFTAYLGGSQLMAAIILGFLVGGLVAVVLVVFRLKALRGHFAFGPPLVIGAYAAIAWGQDIVDWYLG
jgi:leader peptidase (prepilin peptidase)/N-methyltransferase